jgi:hypothetical protein
VISTGTRTAATRPVIAVVGAYDRAFYSGIAIVLAITVFVGFSRTYYLRSYFGGPATVSGAAELTPITRAHAILFTGWVLLFLAQTALVAQRRVALHRRLGVAGAVLAASMIVVGFFTAVSAAARGATVPGANPLTFLAVPLFDLALFAGFTAAAITVRRNRETHKRLMLLAYVSIITAAIARLPGLLPLGPLVFFGLSLLFVIAGIVYDHMSRGRVHPVYWWGGGLIALSIPARLALSGTPAWRTFAEWLVG